MRILSEAITNPPTNLGVYMKIRARRLTEIANDLQQAKIALEANQDNGGDLLQRFLRMRVDPEIALNATWNALPWAIRNADRFVPADDLVRMIDGWRKYGTSFAHFVPERLRYCESLSPEILGAISALSEAEEGMSEYGYQPGDPANAEDEEFVSAMALLGSLRDGAKALRTGANEIANVKSKIFALDEFNKRADAAKWGVGNKNWHPERDEIETLYHATAFATEIAEKGFTAERPVNRRGLGNYGTQNTISFTHDINIAHPILRALREMWMIAHGEITTATILRWMQHEGMDLERSFQIVGRPKPDKDYTADLYRTYLAQTKFRADPVMTYPAGIMQMLKNRRLEDIGIVAAEVRIDNDDEYLFAEREFRVPADRVLRVWRVM